MKKLVVSLVAVGLILTPLFSLASDRADRLLVILTSENSVTQLMSLVLANQALGKGVQVDLLLCGGAGNLAIEGAEEVKLKPKDVSPQMLMKKLISSGSRVEICPPYLPNAGKTPEDLVSGIGVANPTEVADRLLDEDTKILSY